MHSQFTIRRILLRGLASGLVFTAIWASWAYYANLAYGESAAKRAAVTQAVFTGINAFLYTTFMEFMFRASENKLLRFFLSFVLPNVIVTIALTSLHVLRGTPRVLATVLPSLLIVYGLSLFYVLIIGPHKLKSGTREDKI